MYVYRGCLTARRGSWAVTSPGTMAVIAVDRTGGIGTERNLGRLATRGADDRRSLVWIFGSRSSCAHETINWPSGRGDLDWSATCAGFTRDGRSNGCRSRRRCGLAHCARGCDGSRPGHTFHRGGCLRPFSSAISRMRLAVEAECGFGTAPGRARDATTKRAIEFAPLGAVLRREQGDCSPFASHPAGASDAVG
jgi:hypothetical protein